METQLLSQEQITELGNFRTQLLVWKQSTKCLSNLWSDVTPEINDIIFESVADKIPFHQSFDKFSADTNLWVDKTVANIDRELRLQSLLKDGDDKIMLFCEGDPCTLEKLIIESNAASKENLEGFNLDDIRNMKAGEMMPVGMVQVIRLKYKNEPVNFYQECENIVRELDATHYNNLHELNYSFNKLKIKSSELLACKTIMYAAKV